MPANCRRFRRLPKPFASVSIITLSLLAWPDPARAYRPFDGTDAAVAKKGEMEIELQPAGRLRDESGTGLIAPATVINYGLSEDLGSRLRGPGTDATFTAGTDKPDGSGRVPQACSRTRQPAGQNRPKRCDRIWRPYFRTAPAIRASVQAWPESSRSAGIGARFTSTRRLPSRAIIMAISSSAPLSKDRRHGRFAPLPRFSTRTSLERNRLFQAWSA